MNKREACRILEMDADFTEQALKKKYHALMHQAHPDSGDSENTLYDAREINEAYSWLKEHLEEAERENLSSDTGLKEEKIQQSDAGMTEEWFCRYDHWDAPVNEQAYAARDIFHEVEDADCEVIGTIKVAEGKFYWTGEEKFSLFLQSLFTLSGKLLMSCGDMPRDAFLAYQGELSFLLAKQFIDQQDALNDLVDHHISNAGNVIYSVPAMLELGDEVRSLKRKKDAKDVLFYPAAIRHHRLFLKDEAGTEAGYLSFHDDRLYYIVIPLFEDRLVQVRITAAEGIKKARSGKRYLNVILDMKFRNDVKLLPENINMQIERLLLKAKDQTF